MKNMKERFEEKFVVNPDNGCWEWQFFRNKKGYGMFQWSKHKATLAHRTSYKIYVGEFEESLCVLHKCDNPKCVNPDHLFLGTPKDNWQDGFDKERIKLLGGIDTEKLKKHPSIGAYNRGCRCRECKDLKFASQRNWREKQRLLS